MAWLVAYGVVVVPLFVLVIVLALKVIRSRARTMRLYVIRRQFEVDRGDAHQRALDRATADVQGRVGHYHRARRSRPLVFTDRRR